MHLSLSLSLSLSLWMRALPCVLSVQEAGNVGFKHKTSSDKIEYQPRDSQCLWYPRCLYVRAPNTTSDNSALASLSPLSACVCECAGAYSRENTAVENVWKQTQAPSEISVLEEITMLLLKALVSNTVWHFRPKYMRMADSIDRGSEFSCCQHCLISWKHETLSTGTAHYFSCPEQRPYSYACITIRSLPRMHFRLGSDVSTHVS